MTDSKQELKPCPFCGKTPEVTTRDVEPQNDSWYGRKDETFILCDCGACLFEGSFHEGFGASERAIAAWNARPADLTGELVEALRYLSVTADHHRAAAAIAYNAVMGHSRSANDAIDEEIESRSVLEAAQRVAQAVLAKVDAAKEGK